MSNDVKDRGLTGAILDELWPILGGSHTAASVWTEIEDALSPVIAKHRQSAIAELCEGLEKAATWFEECAGAHDRKMREATDSYERARRADKAIRNAERAKELRTLLSKHSPDAPGDAGTRAIEPSDGDKR